MCCLFLLLLLLLFSSLFSSVRTADEAAAAAEQFKTKKLCSRARRCCALLPLLAEGGVGAHAAPRGTNPHTTTRPACGRALARSRRRLHGDVRCLLLLRASRRRHSLLQKKKNPLNLLQECARST